MTTLADKIEALAETLAGALEPLIEQCWSCEKELTEEYYGVHYSGESAPLDDARKALRQYKEAREIERLRGALEQIAQADYGYTDIIESGAPPEKHADYFCSMVTWRQRTARAALAGDSHDQ